MKPTLTHLFWLVTGTGRVGAAVLSSSGEESFFGPPAFEVPKEFLQREEASQKYSSQKIAAAGAVTLYNNKHDGLSHFELNLGLSGRYNEISQIAWPGVGISGIIGPLTFGYSVNEDELVLNYVPYGQNLVQDIQYSTQTFSAGLYLSFAFDFSYMQLFAPGYTTTNVAHFTVSLLLKKWILTASERTTISQLPEYDSTTQSLTYPSVQQNIFWGVQFAATKTILLGAFYHYYLLNELSAGVTLFL